MRMSQSGVADHLNCAERNSKILVLGKAECSINETIAQRSQRLDIDIEMANFDRVAFGRVRLPFRRKDLLQELKRRPRMVTSIWLLKQVKAKRKDVFHVLQRLSGFDGCQALELPDRMIWVRIELRWLD